VTRKSFWATQELSKYLGSEEMGKNTDGPKIQRIQYGISRRKMEADGKNLTSKCDSLLAAAAVCILILLCVCMCVRVCVCVCARVSLAWITERLATKSSCHCH
jgi:hypothetical protein